MKTVQAYYTKSNGWKYITDKQSLNNPLVIVFGDRLLLEDETVFKSIKEQFPYQDIMYGSTAGEIIGSKVFDDSLSVTAIEFEKSRFVIKTDNIFSHDKDGQKLGAALYEKMPKEGLKHMFALSTGSFINGSALIKGLEQNIQNSVTITGGICGDADRFEKTVASYNEPPKQGEVVLVGLYGEDLEITYASFGGFQPFGPERIVTRAEGNIVYEIDDQPALDLYKKYLAEKAGNKLVSRLAYPLNVIQPGRDYAVVRTILDNETEDGSIILAGDCAQDSRVQLMMASVHGIVEGAQEAAKYALEGRTKQPELALLVSCMGRKAIMGLRTEEEIELITDTIGGGTAITGFYSYAEMAPIHNKQECEVHNQTMTLTLLSE